jgi:hypothetical protein
MKMLFRSLLPLVAISTLLSVSVRAQQATASGAQGWPRSFTNNGTAFTVYQPQATSLENGVLSFRMAVSATPQGSTAPGFGTVKLTAITSSNPDGTTVALNLYISATKGYVLPAVIITDVEYGIEVEGSYDATFNFAIQSGTPDYAPGTLA